MKKIAKQIGTIDNYIADSAPEAQSMLKKMRQVIRAAAPKAEEKIAYGIPTFFLNGNLVHFGAFKKHIGFYPAPRALAAFQKELALYAGSKGAVQFPLGKPLPIGLITKIVKYRVRENMKRVK